MAIWQIIVLVFVFFAVFMSVATLILQLRAPNALTRVNLMGPLVCLAFPALILAKLTADWATEGFNVGDFIRAVIAILGVWIVGSVGSFIMGRSIHGVTVVDPRAALSREERAKKQ
ncbi:Na+/H+ antiporter subunit G [Corynebacterium sp. Marseille-P3884]|uniref:Na+/H+ antiporter subunit G n=1 Tax=Corynebacterium sp. Marseille-P3884 TaxID=2495409 RepID=UPI001B3377A9|nr:Na+/H+ antiporter subunit G [Corynebacterium sp. Marseille-P3884]MBP3949280.1 Na+/H+ antiporter subunit G [Corynebacterium sp. Marseille-P3884]